MNGGSILGAVKSRTGIAIGGGLIGGAVGYAVGRATSRRKRKSIKRSSRRKTKSSRHNYRKVRGRRYTPHTAGKGRDTSTKRVRYTKNGQPYVIMASGKARFISKRGARKSHKLKGGRY